MKKIIIIALLLIPSLSIAAGLTLPQGGLGTTTVPRNYVLIGLDANRITAVATSSLGISGSGTVGPGTLNFLSRFTSATTIGDSIIYDTGTNIGIGTTSPYAPLSVAGAGGVVANKYFATSSVATSTFAGPVLMGTSTIATSIGNQLTIINDKKGVVYTTLYAGLLKLGTVNGTTGGSSLTPVSGMFLGQDNTTVRTDGTGFIQQWTNGTAELLSLNPNGGGVAINGIGVTATADPGTALFVTGNPSNNAFMKINSKQNGGYTGLLFRGYNSLANTYVKSGIVFDNRETCSNFCRGDLRFLINNTASNANVSDNVVADTAMIITYESRNVGIGTSTPFTKLAVTGTITANNINATTTTATSTFSGHIVQGSNLVSSYLYPSFSYSTSTAWTGTTTIPLGVSFNGETWKAIKCFTDVGTLNVSINDATNRMNMFNASTTVGNVTLSTNNQFTVSEKRYVDIGTPATAPTKISCTVQKTLDLE